MRINDEKLVEQYIKDNNEHALETLVKRYLPIIYGFIRNYTGNRDNAADITQEVFVKVWKNIKKFDSSKSFKTWIFTIAKHTAIDWLKKKNALPFSMLDDADAEKSFADSLTDKSPSILEKLSLKESSRELKMAIEQLPFGYSSVINLHINQEFSFREIAMILKEPLNTVKSRYRRGLIFLKKLMGS